MKKAFGMLAVLFGMLFIVETANAAAPPLPPRPVQSPIPIVYETPFNVVGGAMVAGSEGKVDLYGNYKVELVTGPGTFDVCMIHAGLDNGPALLETKAADADGELISIGTLEPGHYEQFSFSIHASGLNGPCSGDPLWISGFSIQPPV